MLDPLSRLGDRRRIERVADDDLGAADLERRRLHRVADQDAQLVADIEDLVRHAAANEAGRAQEQDPRHG